MANPENDIHFGCSTCGQNLVVALEGAGLSVECPVCGAAVTVPQQQPPVNFNQAHAFRASTEMNREHSEDRASTKTCHANERLISDILTGENEVIEITGPKTLPAFHGQGRLKARLELLIAAAKKRGEPLPHLLLSGPKGAGKATLAYIVAKAIGTNLKHVTGRSIGKEGDLAGLLTNLEEGDILFIEDIQLLRKPIEEYLYPALVDFKLDIVIDAGPSASTVRLNLPKFTLIGTTTELDRVREDLVRCFPVVEAFAEYAARDVAAIIETHAQRLSIRLASGVAELVAHSGVTSPIDAHHRLQHVRDFAHVKHSVEEITLETAAEALKLLAPAEIPTLLDRNRPAIPAEVRREVWRRDNGRCVKCGSRERLEFDHIIPVIRGGSNTTRNIELLCEGCNRAKSDSIQ